MCWLSNLDLSFPKYDDGNTKNHLILPAHIVRDSALTDSIGQALWGPLMSSPMAIEVIGGDGGKVQNVLLRLWG